MFQSPAKRRRTSPSTFAFVGANGAGTTTTVSNPSTPRRASYLSPTKASLARSHPRILSQTRRTRHSEPRNHALRDEVLGQSAIPRKTETISRTEPAAKADEPLRTADTSGSNTASTTSFNFADIVARTFSSVPKVTRSPLSARQPSADQRAAILGGKPDAASIVPKLVTQQSTRSPRAVSERRSTDPELPPTPVQLGYDQAPERPRGLASSSSPGGSGRRRVRTRDGRVTSSPLKPKEIAPDNTRTVAAEIEIASGISNDDETGTVPEAHSQPYSSDEHIVEASEDLRQKRNSLQQLRHQLQEMNAGLEKLRSISTNIQQSSSTDSADIGEMIAIIQDQNDFQSPNLSDVESHPDLLGNRPAYLNLFAPGNLSLSHTTWTKHIKKRAKIVHQITVHPPAPWPAGELQLTFDTTIDVADARIESISQLNAYSDKTLLLSSSHLQSWISNRLSHQLYAKDLGTLVAGAGNYFEKCVQRAKVLKTLSDIYVENSGADSNVEEMTFQPAQVFQRMNAVVRDEEEAFSLLPFLGKNHMIFKSENSASNLAQKKLMLIYDIELSWTGDAKTKFELVASGVPSKAAKAAEEVFHLAVKTQHVSGAFTAVWDLLEMGAAAKEAPTLSSKSKGKRMRAT